MTEHRMDDCMGSSSFDDVSKIFYFFESLDGIFRVHMKVTDPHFAVALFFMLYQVVWNHYYNKGKLLSTYFSVKLFTMLYWIELS